MIACRTMGGVGNQMFQIAFIESLGAEYNMDVLYTHVENNCNYNINVHHRPAQEYYTMFKNVDWFKNLERIGEINKVQKVSPFYTKITPVDGTEYVGYFQSEKYFDKDLAQWLFMPSDKIKALTLEYDRLFKGTTCSVHVRRGDYLKLSHIHPVLDISYYNEAFSIMERQSIDKYLVFSDDIAWCKENFIGEKFVFIEEKDYIALFLMAKCTHHIIGNSSFSWWGAYLGNVGMVIAPKKYVCDAMMEDHRDVIPNDWIKI